MADLAEMMASDEQSYCLPLDDNGNVVGHGHEHRSRLSLLVRASAFSLLSALTTVLLLVLVFRPDLWSHEGHIELQDQCVDISPHAGLARQPSYNFPYSTGYGPLEATNHTLADEMWEAIDIDPGIVAVPLDWAEQHNLAETQVFPWDQTKGLYVLNAFHTVHCLKILHRVVYDARRGRPLSRDVEHAMNCIDHMRKDAMCNADNFLLPTPPRRQGNPGPRGQSRVCKSWDTLVDWAKEHDACYQHITDDEVGFAANHHEIERYLNCKPDSPYAQKMREYVDSKGGSLHLPSEQ